MNTNISRSITFDFERKDLLNSNNMPNMFIVKSQKAAKLRKIASSEGVEHHPIESLQQAKEKLEILQAEALLTLKKSRAVKALKKRNNSDDIELEIEEIVEKLEREHREDYPVSSDDITITPLFNTFVVNVTVYSPTRRRLDPPNLYPTVKALIDGLTDASWWLDDNYDQLLEMSFRYGGISSNKNHFTIKLDIKEVDKNSYLKILDY